MKTVKLFKIQFFFIAVAVIGMQNGFAQSETLKVQSFNKVIISPHIEVKFEKGEEESVTILSNSEGKDKLNIEVHGKTLRIYLEDAKMTTKSEKVDYEGWKQKVPIYSGTVVTAVVAYKNLDELSLRGEQEYHIVSLLENEKFVLSIYGDSEVVFGEVSINKMKTSIYGESELSFEKGKIEDQKFTVYGEGEVKATEIANKTTKIIAYGEGEFNLNVSERIKVTAYGEAKVNYKGNPKIDKGIVLGEAKIRSIK